MAKLTQLKQNITRGDTPLLSFPITVGGFVVDLTGYKVTLTITATEVPVTGDVPIIQISVNGDATGVANFQLLNDQTLNSTKDLVPQQTYYFDVQLYNNQTGTLKRIATIVRGSFVVDQDFNLSNS